MDKGLGNRRAEQFHVIANGRPGYTECLFTWQILETEHRMIGLHLARVALRLTTRGRDGGANHGKRPILDAEDALRRVKSSATAGRLGISSLQRHLVNETPELHVSLRRQRLEN